MRPPEKRPPDQTAPPSQQPYKKALITNASAKVAQARTETQRISAQKASTQAPREYVATSTDPPDVILLQEPDCNPSLYGYSPLALWCLTSCGSPSLDTRYMSHAYDE
ncbi:hypothetical protein MRX96_022271 [Rhipicephalus microplus]